MQALRCLINTLVSLVQWYAHSNPEAMTEYGQTGVEERGSKGTPGGALMLHGRTTSDDRVCGKGDPEGDGDLLSPEEQALAGAQLTDILKKVVPAGGAPCDDPQQHAA